jgi:hypothetical protein
VNFHDPAKAARDFCAYPSPSESLSHGYEARWTNYFFNSDTGKALAHRRWSLHVGLPYEASLQASHSLIPRSFLLAAGSLSLPLTTSGVYSVAVDDTCGLYGSVAERRFFWDLRSSPWGLRLISAIGLLPDAHGDTLGSNHQHVRR